MNRDTCKDCINEGVTTRRALVPGAPGPRCTTHHRREKRRIRELSHGRRITQHYEMTAEQYQLLYAFQNGKCWICQKATGAARKLAVEHEHGLEGCTHPPDRGCPRCWRGLACKRCNRLIAFLDVDALVRAIVFMTDPPARKLFGKQCCALDGIVSHVHTPDEYPGGEYPPGYPEQR